jgi:hypothetical protein
MTDLLKQLMANYGRLFVTLSQLEKERPGTVHASLADYYKSLGPAEPGEPVLAVRISKDGETRFLYGAAAQAISPDEHKQGAVTGLELPEDEFYFFRAFREGAFDLEGGLPPFLFNMAFVYAYTLFETYLADLVRAQLSNDATIVDLDREIGRFMRGPIAAILERLRRMSGFGDLTDRFDRRLTELSQDRNCLVHNAGKADPKLVAARPSYSLGQAFEVNFVTVISAIQIYRNLAVEMDSRAEGILCRQRES